MTSFLQQTKQFAGLGLVLVGLAACDAGGDAGSDRARFENAVASVGCTVDNDAKAQKVEAMTGLSPDQLGDILGDYYDEGRVMRVEDGFKLIKGPCAR